MTMQPRLIANDLLPHFTAKEYQRLKQKGVFGARPTELLEGVIYEMPPDSVHQAFMARAHTAVVRDLGTAFAVRVQLPLPVKQLDSVPSPDLAVMPIEVEEESIGEPSMADLVLEGSTLALQEDRTTRLRIYARAKIAEYVIANLKERQLEIFSVPDSKRSEYRQSLIVTFDETWRSSRLPALVLRPKELFSERR